MEEPPDDFEPYEGRVVESKISNLDTMLHILKGIMGTGILAVPKGFAYTGLLLGSVGIGLVGAVCSYGINLLISTEYLLCKHKKVAYLHYSEAMEYAMQIGPGWLKPFAKCAGFTVDVFLFIYQIGACCVYVVFVSNNVKKFVDDYYCDVMNVRVYMSLFLILFIAIVLIPNLKLFAPVSGFANLLMLIGLGIILYFVFKDFPSLADRSYFGEPNRWILFIGISLFAMESVGVVCAVEHDMDRPQDFLGVFGVFNKSVMIIAGLYWFIGFFGYGRYGEDAKGSITLNLPPGHPLSQASQMLFAGAVIISYGLQLYPAIVIVWKKLEPSLGEISANKKIFYEFMLRLSLVFLTYFLAMVFANYLGTVIGFMGAVTVSMLGFAFPGLMHLCVLWPDKYGKWNWMYYKDILMVLMGMFVMITGVYFTIDEIINSGPPSAGCKDVNATSYGSY